MHLPSLIAGWGRGRDNYLDYPTVNCQNAHVSCYAHPPFLQTTDPRYYGLGQLCTRVRESVGQCDYGRLEERDVARLRSQGLSSLPGLTQSTIDTSKADEQSSL